MKTASAISRFTLEALEPRILLSADAPVDGPLPDGPNQNVSQLICEDAPIPNSGTDLSYQAEAQLQDIFDGVSAAAPDNPKPEETPDLSPATTEAADPMPDQEASCIPSREPVHPPPSPSQNSLTDQLTETLRVANAPPELLAAPQILSSNLTQAGNINFSGTWIIVGNIVVESTDGNIVVDLGATMKGNDAGARDHLTLKALTGSITIRGFIGGGGLQNLSLEARTIIIEATGTLSSRLVAPAADHATASSTGDSGSISIVAPMITLGDGARVLAHANSGFASGNVTLNANSVLDLDWSMNFEDHAAFKFTSATARINLGLLAMITGRDITADAHASSSKEAIITQKFTHPVRAVATGDIDRDMDVDLILGIYGEPNLLFLNNGTANPFGGVTGQAITADSYLTTSMALADVDKDGDLDLVTGNYGQPNRLYLNNGSANPFAGVAGSNISADAHLTNAITVADVNKDTFPDLIAANHLSTTRLYLNNGTANPFNAVSGTDISTDTPAATSLALGDVDKDNDIDLVVGVLGGANRYYANNGTANPFSGVAGVNITADAHDTTAIALADLDKDLDLDVVAGNLGSPSRLYLNNGTATPFTGIAGSDITSDSGPVSSMAVGDVDNDMDLDVILGRNGATQRLYLNNGTANPFGGVAGTDLSATPSTTRAIALANLNADSRLDLVVGNFNTISRLYLNNNTANPWNGVTGSPIPFDAELLQQVNQSGLYQTQATAAAAIALATAELTIGSGAILRADNNLTLAANASANAQITSQTGYLGLTYAHANPVASVTLTAGPNLTQLSAGTNLTLLSSATALNNAHAMASASEDDSVDAAIAISTTDSSALTTLEGDAQLSAGGALTVAATNDLAISTVADGTAGAQTSAGATLAIAVTQATTRARITGNVSANANTTAIRATTTSRTDAEAQSTPQGATGNTPGNESQTEQELGNRDTKTSDGNIRVAASLAIAVVTSETRASIGTTAPFVTSGLLEITSVSATHSAANADASATQNASPGIGVAVALNFTTATSRAFIDSSADLSAGSITVQAVLPTTGSVLANTFSSMATSGAGSTGVGVAGSLALNIVKTSSEALLLSGSAVTLSGGDLQLLTNTTSLHTIIAQPKHLGAVGVDAGIGASVALSITENISRAEIEDGAALAGNPRDVSISASADHTTNTSAVAGAQSQSGTAISAAVATSIVNNRTTARIGTGPALQLSRNLSLTALHTGSTISTSGGVAAGGDVELGASLALTIANETVQSSLERSLTAGDSATLVASATSLSRAEATASARGGDTQAGAQPNSNANQQTANQRSYGDAQAASHNMASSGNTPSPSAQSGSGPVSVAAAIAVNIANAHVQSSLADGITVITGATLGLYTFSNTDASALADGATVIPPAGPGSNTGIGAAVALNLAHATNEASIGAGALIVTRGLTLDVLINQASDDSHDFSATATAGAGAKDIGVAGAVAVNIVENRTEAVIGTGAVISMDFAPIGIHAENRSSHTVSALPKPGGAAGVNLGIGASFGLNIAENTTRAEIANGTQFEGRASNTSISASSNHEVTTTATSGASSSNGSSVSASAAITIANNSTHARIGTGNRLNLTGSLSLEAIHSGSTLTNATGASVGADLSIGASFALNIANDDVSVTSSRSLRPTGDITMNARSIVNSRATATASAMGSRSNSEAQMAGSNVNQESNNQRNLADQTAADHQVAGSGNTPTPSAQTSDGQISVAAAVSINLTNSTTSTQAADGSINAVNLTLSSANNTDAAAIADGSTVVAAGGGSGSGSVGVGAAVAINRATLVNEAVLAPTVSVSAALLKLEATILWDPLESTCRHASLSIL